VAMPLFAQEVAARRRGHGEPSAADRPGATHPTGANLSVPANRAIIVQGSRDPTMPKPHSPSTVLALVTLTALAAVLPAQIAPTLLRSGNVPPGNLDPAISYLQGPSATAFGFPFAAADFLAARTGPNPIVLGNIAGGWPLQLPLDPSAQWIDTPGSSHTALYAIPFPVAQPFTSAVLTLQFAADDSLGDTVEPGVYVNEVPLAGTVNVGGYYFVENTAHGEIGPLLVQGQNWLYLYLHNTGGRGGLLFHAKIQLDGGLLRTYGSGCSGSGGTPLLLPVGTPQPAAPVELRFYNLPNTPGLLAVVMGLTSQFAFGMPTPVDLGFLGYPGCSAWCDPLTALAVTTNGGAAQQTVTLPGAAFLGQSIFTQGFVFDPSIARGASVSNALELRSGW